MKIQDLGNIEFFNCFLTLHYLKFGYTEKEIDRRIYQPYNISYQFLAEYLNKMTMSEIFFELLETSLEPTEDEDIKILYNKFLEESQKRDFFFDKKIPIRNIIYTKEFENWFYKMKNTPTYIREITSTNFFGDANIDYADNELIGFDYPVRSACKILNEKGYLTYWSSANYEDAKRRKGHVIENKNVAYILIDSQNLDRDLKEELFLTGDCDFWGIALSHADHERYYGVWSEITSVDMKCEILSKNLLEKCNKLPVLEKKKY